MHFLGKIKASSATTEEAGKHLNLLAVSVVIDPSDLTPSTLYLTIGSNCRIADF